MYNEKHSSANPWQNLTEISVTFGLKISLHVLGEHSSQLKLQLFIPSKPRLVVTVFRLEGSPVLPCTIPCPWMTENVKFALHPGATVTGIYWSTSLVRVSLDAIVTLVSLDHHHRCQYILVYPPCQSIPGCQS